MENITINFPNYKDIVSEIKQQLSKRAGLIIQRTTFGLLPGLIIFAPLLILGFGLKLDIISLDFLEKNHLSLDNIWVLAFMLFYGIVAALYILAISHIIFVEKMIWIDSYFDTKNLSPSSSLKIAKKLFIPSYKMYLILFLRYYFLPCIIFLGLASYFLFFVLSEIKNISNGPETDMKQFLLVFASFLVGTLLFGFYTFYYLDAKLRYFWYLYLDGYGKNNFSFSVLIKQMNELNEVNKGESFKKSIVSDIGIDVLGDAVKIIGRTFIFPVDRASSSFGRTSSEVVGGYASGIISELGTFSKLTTNYILYKYSRNYLYKESQSINENIYDLAKE